jgi:hypothetical protein
MRGVKQREGPGSTRSIWFALLFALVTAGLVPLLSGSSSGAAAITTTSTQGCHAAVPSQGRATSIPMRVFHRGPTTIAVVSACIDGAGPFGLVVDTGSTSSAIVQGVAQRLHLPSVGSPKPAAGLSCQASTQPVTVASWSIGPVALVAQTVSVAPFPGLGVGQAPVGVLGSDVLSRFGAVKIDYAQQRLIVPGPEGATPTGAHHLEGPSNPPPPRDLRAGRSSSRTVPLTVASAGGQVRALVPVHLGTSPASLFFLLDTGSATSSVSSTAVARTGLRVFGDHRVELGGLGCRSSVSVVESGSWSLSTTPLAPQHLVEVKLPATGGAIAGTLGSDVLSRFGSVIVDFADGRLLLG